MNTGNKHRDIVVAALKHAAPYIRMFKRKIFVIKAGGVLFSDAAATHALIEQITILHQVGVRVVIVHGAGPQSTALAAERGLETRMVQGRRVTDAATLEVSAAANLQISEQIMQVCSELGVQAQAVRGADNGLVLAHQRPPVAIDGVGDVNFGYVGDIDAVDCSSLETLLDDGIVPVVSPISADQDGTLLNINADTVAAALAGALQAEKLILATGAPGILEDIRDVGSLVSYLDLAGLQTMRDNGSLADGMLPKAKAIEAAINGGVKRVHVISYAAPDSVLLEVFTNEGTGTMIVKSIAALTEAEQATSQTAA
jgi:acetylglutamate kinase